MDTQSLNPLPVVHLFPVVDAALMSFLSTLSEQEWNAPTLAKQWSVKDIALHLLDGNIRTLSMQRDGYFGIQPSETLDSYQKLVQWINTLNNDWIHAARRMSSDVLMLLLEATNPPVQRYYVSLQPFEEAIFSVAWAGEEKSYNWMHLAREYTEKWHHQQQIREAVGRELLSGQGIMTQELFRPLIATFLRGLPHTYRTVTALEGVTINVYINNTINNTSESHIGGTWHLVKEKHGWELREDAALTSTADVVIPPETAWKLFCKGVSAQEARTMVQITGDTALGELVLQTVSVMA